MARQEGPRMRRHQKQIMKFSDLEVTDSIAAWSAKGEVLLYKHVWRFPNSKVWLLFKQSVITE